MSDWTHFSLNRIALLLNEGDSRMKSKFVMMLVLLSTTFALDSEAAKKKSKHGKHQAKHAVHKKNSKHKRKPATEVAMAKKQPKKEQIIDMTADPNRPLTWDPQ